MKAVIFIRFLFIIWFIVLIGDIIGDPKNSELSTLVPKAVVKEDPEGVKLESDGTVDLDVDSYMIFEITDNNITHGDDITVLCFSAKKNNENALSPYADSKLLMNIFVERILMNQKEKFNRSMFISCHPGVVPGPLYRHTNKLFQFGINKVLRYLLRSNKTAALRMIELLMRDDIKSGVYYEDEYDCSTVTEMVPVDLRQKLYEKIMEEINAL
uniref:Uncharacterized protein n=1 Tax=Panagrolaimus sp. JU765 TaxID=591449 RepID=A0AC34RLY5_9BILA